MSATSELTTKKTVDGLKTLMGSALRSPTVDAFVTLEQQLSRFDSELRELHQEMLGDRARTALANLRNSKPLTEQDQQTLRELVVGDADSYLKMENNLQDWLNEVNRLQEEMERLAGSADERALHQLRGVVRDATRLVPTIRSYMEERDRVERFTRAMINLDDANRTLLIQVVAEMMSSRTR